MSFRKLLIVRAFHNIKRSYATERNDRNYSTALGYLHDVYDPDESIEHVDKETTMSPKAYSEIPGPKELPLIGNAWRFAPVIGKWKDN